MGFGFRVAGFRVQSCRVRVWGLGGAFKAHRLLYHSTLGLRVINKKQRLGGGCIVREVEMIPPESATNRPVRLTRRGTTHSWDLSGRGTTRAEDAQGKPTQNHLSPSILVYEDTNRYCIELLEKQAKHVTKRQKKERNRES